MTHETSALAQDAPDSAERLSVAVVADAHLGGPGGPAGPLVEQLEGLPARGCGHLLLLGDLVQLWIGDARYETGDVRLLVECLRRLRRAGVWVDYVEGNRDFFLATSPWADAFDRVTTEVAFTTGGVRYLALHGDGLDERDWKYRFWRRVSKSATSRFVATRLPRRWAGSLVRSTEETLSRTNREHKRHIPRQALREYGAHRLAQGHDVLLLGHFHEPHVLEVPGGEVRLLDAWFRSRRIEWLGEPAA